MTDPRRPRPGKPAARPGPGKPAPPPIKLLDDADLDDPERYVKLESIPLLDVHKSKEKGDVGEGLLDLIARNSNARAARGDYAPVLLGHTNDEDIEEHRQPPTVGFSRNFHIKPFRGRPCLHADFHIHRDQYGAIPTYPNRSVERMKSETNPDVNWIDAVSLLRKAPERDLGRLGYDRSMPDGAALVRYARDLGGLPDPVPVGPVPYTPEEYDHCADQVLAGLWAHECRCRSTRARQSANRDMVGRLRKTLGRETPR